MPKTDSKDYAFLNWNVYDDGIIILGRIPWVNYKILIGGI